jgi:hypothetical protein
MSETAAVWQSKDLGYANGWRETPEIIKKCKEMGHQQYTHHAGNCLTEYGCGACHYTYLVDSSG